MYNNNYYNSILNTIMCESTVQKYLMSAIMYMHARRGGIQPATYRQPFIFNISIWFQILLPLPDVLVGTADVEAVKELIDSPHKPFCLSCVGVSIEL